MPVVSEAVLYKVWLGAAWAGRGAPGEDDLQQVNEWLNSRPPEIATCLREMHPPNRPLEASVLFGDTPPPEQLEGKILLLRFVRQYFAKSGNASEAPRSSWQSWNIGPESKPASWQTFASNSTPNGKLSRSQGQQGQGWSLASLLSTASAYAVAGGDLCVRPNFPVQPVPGRESGGRVEVP